jgi:hypothetical protein
LAVVNYAILAMTVFLMIGGKLQVAFRLCRCELTSPIGLYTSLKALIDIFNDPNSTLNGPFTCADNSIF